MHWWRWGRLCCRNGPKRIGAPCVPSDRRPRKIEFIAVLPMTTGGKVQRRVSRLHELAYKKILLIQ
jgi:acyl-CoA synthetase (AMP-forming)/AMP-acid ligase II